MIIEKLSLKNWRGYRECHTFSFKKEFNLVLGPNEAGKSTLFEALTRVLFDRCKSTADEIRNIQPWNSSLGPEAELVFSDKGHRYKIKKRFLQKQFCELWTDRNGEWVREHEGDRAEREIQEKLKGTPSARSAAQPEHRGLAQALWYLQKEDPLPKSGDWVDGIKSDIANIIEIAVKLPEEDKIIKLISDGYNDIYTAKTGKPKKNSDLVMLQDDFKEKSANLESLEETAREIIEYYDVLEKNELKLINSKTILNKLENEAVNERISEDTHRKKRIDEIEPGLKTIDSDLQMCHAIENYSYLIEERKRIEKKSKEISIAEQNYQTKEKELDELHAPDGNEWRDFENSWDKLQKTDALIRANAIFVKIDLQEKNVKIILQPKATQVGEEYLLKEPTSFKIGDVGAIHIRGGGSSLKDLNDESQQLHAIVDPYCSRYNVIDKQAFNDLYLQRVTLENAVDKLRGSHDRLLAEIAGEDPQELLKKLSQKIDEISQFIDKAPENLKKSSMDQLKGKIEKLEESKAVLTRDKEKEQNEEDAARNKIQTIQTTIDELKEKNRTIEGDNIEKRTKIGTYSDQGLYSETSDLQAYLKETERQLEKMQSEADAIRLLHEMTTFIRQEQSRKLAIPISKNVNEWLSFLTNGAYDSLEMNETLLPYRVHNKKFDASVDLENISYGTKEQIVVLLRLALGKILSKNERNLVVIDDRLVNADPERMKRLSVILEDVAKNSCQIVIASCNSAPYQGIKEAHIIQVPSDGKIS